ncbi:Rab3 GTPase-activating protein catalytic subunit-domain-containing protein [Pilobolus umbonatus]|nr:Rab3 GTPase-activating protein catalytic subunit-domain-containing protein [Pilobolus umbonatus]
MNYKRRQSSSYSEEPFEFVDYTSVSNFEKIITHIEDHLTSWNVKDGCYGIFSDEHLEAAVAAISTLSANEFTREEHFSVGDGTYSFTYYCYPAHLKESEESPLSMSEFHCLGPIYDRHHQQSNQQFYHPLHRWTGQNRLLIIKPVQDPSRNRLLNLGKSVVDLFQAKHLISACAIAFQNTGCSVPVFVPIGQSRYDMYMGYMLVTGQRGNPLDETEERFNMSITSSPKFDMSPLKSVKDLFFQKLSRRREDYGKSGEVNDNVFMSAVYTYNLKNWFDENWKNSDDDLGHSKKKMERRFSDDFDAWEGDTMEHGGSIQRLPFGPSNDPLRTLTLTAIFPLTEYAVSDDDNHELNMDALSAEHWEISKEFTPISQQKLPLSRLIEQTVNTWIKDPSNHQYLAPYDNNNDDDSLFNDNPRAMRNLYIPQPSYTNTNEMTRMMSEEGDQITVIKSEQVEDIIAKLFHPYSKMPRYEMMTDDEQSLFYSTQKLGLRLRTSSSVPYKSFLWNMLFYSLDVLSQNISNQDKHNAIDYMGFLRIIWQEVLRKIRWHWENLVPIPDLNPYLYENSSTQKDGLLGIDLRFNILHQKISMVNCCIYRKLQNAPQNGDTELDVKVMSHDNIQGSFDNLHLPSDMASSNDQLEESTAHTTHESGNISDSIAFTTDMEDQISLSDSDVFFDTVDTAINIDIVSEDSDDAISASTSLSETPSEVANPFSMAESFVRLPYKPNSGPDPYSNDAHDAEVEIKDADAAEGCLKPHDSLRLLKTDKIMQIPIVQDPGFMTDDMITQQATVFERLGTSDSATQLRAKLQSAQLYSDMQSFKAANPHATLEDFVRWHSPRDWVEATETSEGKLSIRMSEPNNIWQELWNCSRRVPSSRQKPLFNLCVEAEKALYFLETTPIQEFFSIMLPTLTLIAYDTLSTHPIVHLITPLSIDLSKLGQRLIMFPWDDLRHGKHTLDDIITAFRHQESQMSHAITLLRKLPRQYELVSQLILIEQTKVEEGEQRAAVFELFKNEHGMISKPSCREYLFYSDCRDLTTNGRCLPQRQYSIIKDNELRVIDMHTTDALYS